MKSRSFLEDIIKSNTEVLRDFVYDITVGN